MKPEEEEDAMGGQQVDPEILDEVEGAQIPNVGKGAIGVMSSGASIVRAENDALVEYAIRYPRDPARALAAALAELGMDADFASRQWYSIPYKVRGEAAPGQALCPCQGKRPGHPKDPHTTVEGVSIKGALAMARSWGNCGVKARTVEETDDRFLVEGIAIDRQTGFTVSREGAVSKYYKPRGSSKLVKHSDEKFPQLIAIAQSKQARNALLAILPESMIRRYWSRARELTAQVESGAVRGEGQKPEKKGAGLMQAFGAILYPRPKDAESGWKIDWKDVKRRVEAVLGKTIQKATPDDLAGLRGILNAIESGEAAVADYFPAEQAEEKDEPKAVDPGTADPSGPLPNGRYRHADGTQSPAGEVCGLPLCKCSRPAPADALRGERVK